MEMNLMKSTRKFAPLFCLLLAWFAVSQAPVAAQKGAGGQPGKDKAGEPAKPKKYDDVITKDAQSLPGMFTVHRVNDKIYFEIPHEAMGRLLFWRAEVAKGPVGVSWGGMELGHQTLRFERRGNKIYLWKVAFSKRADDKA